MKSILKKLYIIQVLLLVSSMALSSAGSFAAAPISSSALAKSGKANLEILSSQSAVGDSDVILLGLKFELASGWKTYWRSPGTSGYGMTINWNGSQNVKNAEILWPFPKRMQTVLGVVNGYSGEVVFPIKLHLQHKGKAVVARLDVDYLICDLWNCIPQNNDLMIKIPAGKPKLTPSADLIHQYINKVPKNVESPDYRIQKAKLIVQHAPPPFIRLVLLNLKSKFTPENLPLLFGESNTHLFVDIPSVKIEDGGRKAIYTLTVYRDQYKIPSALPQLNDSYLTVTYGDQKGAYEIPLFIEGPPIGWLTLFAMVSIAFLGGLILNIMPCVLPVLSLKVFAFLRQRQVNLKEVRFNFAATVAGIITSFLLVAIILMVLRTAGLSVGWGFQFQHPTFLIILIVILTVFAGNLFGFFEFRLSGFVSRKSSALIQFEGLLGSFLEGFLVTLLATPCTAPFVGTAIGFAFTQHAFITFIIFLSMGTGLAFPYLLIAIFPNAAHFLPKPGAWMLKVKHIMAILLLLTALWLNFVLSFQIGWSSSIAIFVLMGFVLATLEMGNKIKSASRKLIWGAVAILIAFAFIVPPNMLSTSPKTPRLDDLWYPFDQEKIAALIKQNKVVFIDVTAEWCLTCKTNELLTLKQKQVKERLSKPDVVAMKADWTNQDPQITQFLKQFNVYGIPFYIVYGCHIPGGLELGQILTPKKVLDAIDKAKCT